MDGFGYRIRKLRRDKDITQGQLAEVLGLVPSAVGKYERTDSSYPSVDTLIKIADYFQVSIDYLLKGTVPGSMDNNVSGQLSNGSVVQGNNNRMVLNGKDAVSPEAMELVRIFESLNVRDRIKLLSFALSLEEGGNT